MTNQDYWQSIVGEQTPEEFLRAYGTADPELGLERFLEDRGQLYGVINQGSWSDTFAAEKQHDVLTARVYLLSYFEDTREEWQPAVEAQPPKVVRRYRPVYDLPVPKAAETESKSDSEENVVTPDGDQASDTPAADAAQSADEAKPAETVAQDDAEASAPDETTPEVAQAPESTEDPPAEVEAPVSEETSHAPSDGDVAGEPEESSENPSTPEPEGEAPQHS
jgi:hypothetical protein